MYAKEAIHTAIVHLGCISTGAQPSPPCCLLDLLVLLLSGSCVANGNHPIVSDAFNVKQHVGQFGNVQLLSMEVNAFTMAVPTLRTHQILNIRKAPPGLANCAMLYAGVSPPLTSDSQNVSCCV